MGLIQHRLGWRPRAINIVDAASFAVMRELEIETAFAFDHDFRREGFELLG